MYEVQYVFAADVLRIPPEIPDGVWRVCARCASCGDAMCRLIPGLADSPTRGIPRTDTDAGRADLLRCRACGYHAFAIRVGRCSTPYRWWNPWTWWKPRMVWDWREDSIEITPAPGGEDT